MTEVTIRPNEPFEKALRRFKRKCQTAGIVSELRKREHFETPSVRRKKKDISATLKLRKRIYDANR